MMKYLFIGLLTLGIALADVAKASINIFAYSREAPKTKIYNAQGEAKSLYDFGDNFVIAVFWSKTCVPCLREMEDLNSFANKTKDKGIKVILVSPEKEWANQEEQIEILKKYGGQDLDFYIDKKSALANEFGIFTSPHAVLIDEDKMEIGRIRGSADWDDSDMVKYIDKLKTKKAEF